MSNALHYRSNLRDIQFNLFEVSQIGSKVLGKEPYGAMDEDSARDALIALDELARTKLAASFYDSDRIPLRQDENGDVFLPPSLKKSLQEYWDSEWHMLELPEHLGGFGAPPSVIWAAFELIAGANPSAAFYLFGTFISRIIDRLGTDSQKKRFLAAHIKNRWGGTMVLTEPDAGSDVGAGRSRAKQVEGDLWEIEGTKRFITNGDFDATENVIHLVLARPEGAEVGTKGLSLFIVPKFWVNEDGSLGERNGVRVSKVEKKMGIKGSATCELVLGGDVPCRGFLMGDKHDGIKQMFHVIEQARMAVGMKSMATLSTAYLNALDYTKERIQSADLTQIMDKTAPRVRIIQHPDVRRMLMAQKSHAEGMRALAFFAAHTQDMVEIQGGHGSAESKKLDRLNDLLLPLVKGYNSEKGYELLAVSLQCIGGSGYCQDYPFEQYIRDQKIDSLYEGTTHIQAQDLIFRKIMRDGGATLQGLMAECQKTIASESGGEQLATAKKQLERALGEFQGIAGALLGKMNEHIYHVGLQANKVLIALAEVVIAWLLVKHACIAADKLPTAKSADKAFYAGKIASAQWFCANVLPALTLTRKLIEASELSLTELPEEIF